jgi:hypothetical protein
MKTIRHFTSTLALLAAAFLALAPAAQAFVAQQPEYYRVTGNADDGLGTVDTAHAGTQADPYIATELRAALDAANAAGSGIIVFDPALAGQTITLGGTELAIDSNVTITGPGANLLTISGGGVSRVFNIGSVSQTVNVTLSGMTLTNGTTATSGGGIYNGSTGTLALTNCTLAGNSATQPGSSGGGIDNASTGAITLANCTFSGNSADFGGGIFNSDTGTLTLTNCTLSGNSATNFGGGIVNLSTAAATLTNCTVAGNSATNSGDGIFNTGGGTVTLQNTIDVDSSNGAITDAGYNIIGGTAAEAGLGGLRDNGGPTQTMALLPGSPAIDAGSNALAVDANNVALTGDERGLARVVNGTVDIGAYEAVSSLVVKNTNDSGPDSLREVVKDIAPYGTVTFSDGTNGTTDFQGGTNTITLTTGAISIYQGVTITGPGAGKLTLDGNQASRIFNISPFVGVNISGLTITHGNGDGGGNGGAIYNIGSLTLSDCVITGNSGYGGGVTYGDGYFQPAVTILRCTVSGNTGVYGGAFYVQGYNPSYLVIRDSTISGNTATLDGNGNGGQGGAIYTNGAGYSANVSIVNSTVAGNSAVTSGGAIYNLGNVGAGVTIVNSTLAGNTAPTASGIYNDGTGGGAGVAIGNSILANGAAGANYVSSNGAVGTSFGYNIVDDTTATFLTASGDQSNVDPKLQKDPNDATKYLLANNGGPTQTVALLLGSPAVDQGKDIGPDGVTPTGQGPARCGPACPATWHDARHRRRLQRHRCVRSTSPVRCRLCLRLSRPHPLQIRPRRRGDLLCDLARQPRQPRPRPAFHPETLRPGF